LAFLLRFWEIWNDREGLPWCLYPVGDKLRIVLSIPLVSLDHQFNQHNIPNILHNIYCFFNKEYILISRWYQLHLVSTTTQYPNGSTDAYSPKKRK
jgi:hypothetical protein